MFNPGLKFVERGNEWVNPLVHGSSDFLFLVGNLSIDAGVDLFCLLVEEWSEAKREDRIEKVLQLLVKSAIDSGGELALERCVLQHFSNVGFGRDCIFICFLFVPARARATSCCCCGGSLRHREFANTMVRQNIAATDTPNGIGEQSKKTSEANLGIEQTLDPKLVRVCIYIYIYNIKKCEPLNQ